MNSTPAASKTCFNFARASSETRGPNPPSSRLTFILPWSFSEEAAAEKHMVQLQHNMCDLWDQVGRFKSDCRGDEFVLALLTDLEDRLVAIGVVLVAKIKMDAS